MSAALTPNHPLPRRLLMWKIGKRSTISMYVVRLRTLSGRMNAISFT